MPTPYDLVGDRHDHRVTPPRSHPRPVGTHYEPFCSSGAAFGPWRWRLAQSGRVASELLELVEELPGHREAERRLVLAVVVGFVGRGI